MIVVETLSPTTFPAPSLRMDMVDTVRPRRPTIRTPTTHRPPGRNTPPPPPTPDTQLLMGQLPVPRPPRRRLGMDSTSRIPLPSPGAMDRPRTEPRPGNRAILGTERPRSILRQRLPTRLEQGDPTVKLCWNSLRWNCLDRFSVFGG